MGPYIISKNLVHVLYSLYFLEVVHNEFDVVAVVDAHFDGSVEYTVVGLDGQTSDVDIHLRRDDTRHIDKDAHTVYALNADGSTKEELLVHVPLGIKNTIAIAGLKPVGNGT